MRQTLLRDAALAVTMKEEGESLNSIHEKTGLPKSTVADIVNGRGPWGEIRASNQVFQRHRAEQKKIVQLASYEIQKKCLERIENKIGDCSAPQAAMVLGVLNDKDRLMHAEHLEVHIDNSLTIQQITNLEVLAGKLAEVAQMRAERKSKEIEVGPAQKEP